MDALARFVGAKGREWWVKQATDGKWYAYIAGEPLPGGITTAWRVEQSPGLGPAYDTAAECLSFYEDAVGKHFVNRVYDGPDCIEAHSTRRWHSVAFWCHTALRLKAGKAADLRTFARPTDYPVELVHWEDLGLAIPEDIQQVLRTAENGGPHAE